MRAFVDETGDRGVSRTASRFFAMAAVVVADERVADMNSTMLSLRGRLSVPDAKPMHWQEHVKTYQRRQYVASSLGDLSDVVVNYVVFEKGSIPSHAALRVDQAMFYNYAAGLLLERIVMTARDWAGGERDVIVRYGHVRGFDHDKTAEYLRSKPQQRACRWLPWHLVRGDVAFWDAGRSLGLQAADQYAGMLNVALTADRYGGYEPWHLLRTAHQIRRGSRGQALNYGLKTLVAADTLTGYPWWEDSGLA
ncbi:MAG: DUF3800 domain-containing protein [Dermatophilaceae bacterium]